MPVVTTCEVLPSSRVKRNSTPLMGAPIPPSASRIAAIPRRPPASATAAAANNKQIADLI
jgi:hypothetical protein